MSEFTNTTFSSDAVENTETTVQPIEILETHENPNGEIVELVENDGTKPEVIADLETDLADPEA